MFLRKINFYFFKSYDLQAEKPMNIHECWKEENPKRHWKKWKGRFAGQITRTFVLSKRIIAVSELIFKAHNINWVAHNVQSIDGKVCNVTLTDNSCRCLERNDTAELGLKYVVLEESFLENRVYGTKANGNRLVGGFMFTSDEGVYWTGFNMANRRLCYRKLKKVPRNDWLLDATYEEPHQFYQDEQDRIVVPGMCLSEFLTLRLGLRDALPRHLRLRSIRVQLFCCESTSGFHKCPFKNDYEPILLMDTACNEQIETLRLESYPGWYQLSIPSQFFHCKIPKVVPTFSTGSKIRTYFLDFWCVFDNTYTGLQKRLNARLDIDIATVYRRFDKIPKSIKIHDNSVFKAHFIKRRDSDWVNPPPSNCRYPEGIDMIYGGHETVSWVTKAYARFSMTTVRWYYKLPGETQYTEGLEKTLFWGFNYYSTHNRITGEVKILPRTRVDWRNACNKKNNRIKSPMTLEHGDYKLPFRSGFQNFLLKPSMYYERAQNLQPRSSVELFTYPKLRATFSLLRLRQSNEGRVVISYERISDFLRLDLALDYSSNSQDGSCVVERFAVSLTERSTHIAACDPLKYTDSFCHHKVMETKPCLSLHWNPPNHPFHPYLVPIPPSLYQERLPSMPVSIFSNEVERRYEMLINVTLKMGITSKNVQTRIPLLFAIDDFSTTGFGHYLPKYSVEPPTPVYMSEDDDYYYDDV